MRGTWAVLGLVLASFLLSADMTTSAQEPRTIVSLPTDFASGTTYAIPMPNAGDVINVSVGAQTEPGEPMPSCSGGVLGDYSVWFTLVHPGGTLIVNTYYNSGSSYDTIVQLFRRNTLSITDLTEVACNDDFGGLGATDSAISAVLPSDTYIVRISCKANCGGTFDLALEVAFIPPAGAVPANDNVANAEPITFNKAKKPTNIGFVTVEPNENEDLDCALYHTMWYRFTVPRGGYYTVSVRGSYTDRPFYSNLEVGLAVYRVLPNDPFAAFIRYGCNAGGSGIPGGTITNMLFTTTYDIYIRVGTPSNLNMLDDSQYVVRVSPESMGSLVQNGTFDSGTAGWTLKGTDALDGIVFSPLASLRLNGAPGKSSSAAQVINPADLLLTKAEEDASLITFVTYSTGGTVSDNGEVSIKIRYTDGTPSTKAKASTLRVTNNSQDLYLAPTFASKNVRDITVKLQNKSTGGYIDFDAVQMTYVGSAARERKGDGLLPLPAPAWRSGDTATFRGQN